MTPKRVATLTTHSGERFLVSEERQPSQTFGARFMILFDHARKEIVEKVRRLSTLRVWLVLPDYLEWQAWKQIRQADIAERLGMAQPDISVALKELLALEVIEKRGRGPRTEWRLSTRWSFVGNPDSFHAIRRGRATKGAQSETGDIPNPQNIYCAASEKSDPPSKRQRRLRLLAPV